MQSIHGQKKWDGQCPHAETLVGRFLGLTLNFANCQATIHVLKQSQNGKIARIATPPFRRIVLWFS